MASRVPLDREAVVRAAAQLADGAGGKEISLAELATYLGIRTPSLYNHIAGQDGLRRDLTLLGLHELMLVLGRAVMGKAGDDALLALARAYRAFAREHPGLYARTLHAPDPSDPQLVAASDEIITILLAVLAAYDLHGDAAVHVIRGLRSLLHGFVSLELSGGFGLPLDLDTSFEYLVHVFIDGLLRRAVTVR